ncbi:MAG: hypothetical protein ACLFQ8_01280 [Candidatus Aenigmatarchaeota archaeon]
MINRENKKGQFTILIATLIFTAMFFLVLFTINYFVELKRDVEIEVEEIDRHTDEIVLSAFLRTEDDNGESVRRKFIDYIYTYNGRNDDIDDEIEDLENKFQGENGDNYYIRFEYQGNTYIHGRPDDPRKEVASRTILLGNEKLGRAILVDKNAGG